MHTWSGDETQVAVLGPVLVAGRDAAPVEPPGPRAKALVVALALAAGRVVSPSRLIDDIWGDDAPGSARAALHALVSRTRAVCAEGLVVSAPGGYRLDVERRLVDLHRARGVRDQATALLGAGEASSAAAVVTDALGLWRAEPAIDASASPAVDSLTAESQELQRSLRMLQLRCLVELGAYAEAVEPLVRECAASPVDEPLHELLVRTLHGLGRDAEALGVYEDLRQRLDDQLGATPTPALAALHLAILRDDEPAPTSSQASRSHVVGLRAAANELLGRADAVEQIEAMMRVARLTTILGAGGLGKTRLAQEIGRRAATGTPSVVFVELASVRTGDDVMLALASALGIREPRATNRLSQLAPATLHDRVIERLAERRTLLIIDNCEHVVDAAARLVDDVLAASDLVQVLATSRAPLAIAAEHVYQLDPLPARDAHGGPGAAVRLFRDRARAARPSVKLDDDAVARLCTRLDGLPLAIELAAAKVRTMSVDEIERRLDDRFALLTGSDRSAPDRHRTLMAVIDWSWNLLDAGQQAAMRRLCRFPDGFGVAAAHLVVGLEEPAGASARLRVEADLEALVNQSLVTVTDDERTGQARYRMLETVREYGDLALTASGEDDAVRAAMAAWAEQVCVGALAHSYGREQVATMAAILAEQDNLVWVLREAMARREQRTVVLVFALLANFWSLRGMHAEVLGFSPEIVAALSGFVPAADTIDAAVTTFGLIVVTASLAHRRTAARARHALRRAVASGLPLAALPATMADLVLSFGTRPAMMAALERAQSSPEPAVACMGFVVSAAFFENEGSPEVAEGHAREAYARARRSDEVWGQAMAAQILAQLLSQSARPDEALEWAQRAISLLELVNADGDVRQLRGTVAINEIVAGRPATGRSALTDLTADADESAAVELASLRASAVAEADLADGKIERGLAHYRRAAAEFSGSAWRMSPWSLIIAAASICAHVRYDADGHDAADVASWVRRLRHRILARHRWGPAYTDLPVAGSALLGVAVGTLASAEADTGTPERIRVGLEVLALSERFRSRQDLPALHREPHVKAARRAHGDTAVDAAWAAVETLDRDAAFARAIELLGHPALVGAPVSSTQARRR